MASPKKTTAARRTPRSRNDAIALLRADHRRVKTLFKRFGTIREKGPDSEKAALARQACEELKLHARLEEEIFYPAVREALDEDDLLDEAEVEHASAKDLIAQLDAMKPGDPRFDAKVTVLGEYIEHHVGEEEGELFPKVLKARGLDTLALGAAMRARRPELVAELGAGLPAAPAPARKAAARKPSR